LCCILLLLLRGGVHSLFAFIVFAVGAEPAGACIGLAAWAVKRWLVVEVEVF
jgi:hypothetical protein